MARSGEIHRQHKSVFLLHKLPQPKVSSNPIMALILLFDPLLSDITIRKHQPTPTLFNNSLIYFLPLRFTVKKTV